MRYDTMLNVKNLRYNVTGFQLSLPHGTVKIIN